MTVIHRIKNFFLFSFLFFSGFFVTGCSSLSYTLQIVNGHFEVLSKSEPVDEVIEKPETSALLRQKLLLAKSARAFASENLNLPKNSSYSRYTNLGRDAVVWNVVVAKEFSLDLENWCFPLAGCVSYKGFYSLKDAEKFAEKKRSVPGTEVAILDVPAYSTLGWSNWLGGDPLLNTFIYGADIYVVGLIFHELAHQKIYVNDDSSFNEAFATAVERGGVNAWLKINGPESNLDVYKIELERRKNFNDLLANTSADLRALFKSGKNSSEMKKKKKKIFIALRKKLLSSAYLDNFQKNQKTKYVNWVKSINNAYLGMVGLYEDLTPGFTVLIEKSNFSWSDFYQKVEKISKLPKLKRREVLLKYASEIQ